MFIIYDRCTCNVIATFYDRNLIYSSFISAHRNSFRKRHSDKFEYLITVFSFKLYVVSKSEISEGKESYKVARIRLCIP